MILAVNLTSGIVMHVSTTSSVSGLLVSENIRKLKSGPFGSAANGSTEVLEDILTCDECDVDLVNNLEKATPLHLALLKLDGETLEYVVYQLIESGADIKCVPSRPRQCRVRLNLPLRIKDKHGRTAVELAQIKGIRDKVLQWNREAHGPPPPAISNDDVADGAFSPFVTQRDQKLTLF